MKKLSGKQKGDLSEQKTHKYLEEKGFVVYSVPQKLPRWTVNKDIFNLFDHVAISMSESIIGASIIEKDTVVFIQTKTNRVSKKVLEVINDFSIYHNLKCLVFVWKDDGSFIIYR